MAEFPHSRNRVNKAGIAICEALRTQTHSSLEDFMVADDWRSSHGRPLNSVTMSLRSFSKTLAIQAPITQRHKRLQRIIDKLMRSDGKTMLARMNDIGGARVVFKTLDDLRRFEAHLDKTWKPGGQLIDTDDYVVSPKATGYRAVHKIVRRNDRRIEVQLRTEWMHDWANTVERFGRRAGVEFKTGAGHPDFLEYFAVVAEMNAVIEEGELPSEALHSRHEEALSRLRGTQ